MSRAGWLGWASAVTLVVGVSGCGSTALDRRAAYVQENAVRIHDAALRCDAEREIALAESHLEFGRYEMNAGKYLPAREHIDIAEENVKAAMRIVDDRPECFGIQVVTDVDQDGIPDNVDNCMRTPNPGQEDLDGDGQGDVCDDDMDGDGVPNATDNCPRVYNPDQADVNRDGVGDACSADRDGDGIPDRDDLCPNDPEDRDGFQDEDGCPDPDNDGDGIPDTRDACPNEPEDIDGFEDEDGCPDPDNDGDGILDVNDACPMEPEDFDGDRDEDGCPEEAQLVVLTADRIEISQQINFKFNSAEIVACPGRTQDCDVTSFMILNEVARILRENPTIELEIQGHTDQIGKPKYNQQLSESRADSVRTALIERGIEPRRLLSNGYGQDRPIDDCRKKGDPGCDINRRVEFHVTRR